MRQVIDGNGNDSTAATLAWLKANRQLRFATLYLIGEPEDPQAQWLTDWESPLLWQPWGTFKPAVIRRSTVTSQIGLQVDTLDLEWSPPLTAFTSSLSTSNPYQLARLGVYSNWRVRTWTAYMPTPGDVQTFGASELFGGRIAETNLERGLIKFKVNSFLDVVNQKVPTGVIEILNTLAQFKAATPPAGLTEVPRFDIVSATDRKLVLDCSSPTAHQIFDDGVFQYGYLVFNPGGTLDGAFSAVRNNFLVTVTSVNYNQVNLLDPLPWSPTPGVDTCYISAAFPINQADGQYFGFPFVPPPESSV